LTKLSLSDYTKGLSKSEYDLYGIVNHYSFSTIGGHYAAYVKNESMKNMWVNCNDSMLDIHNDKDVVTKDAYLLFYKRRAMSSSIVINLGY